MSTSPNEGGISLLPISLNKGGVVLMPVSPNEGGVVSVSHRGLAHFVITFKSSYFELLSALNPSPALKSSIQRPTWQRSQAVISTTNFYLLVWGKTNVLETDQQHDVSDTDVKLLKSYVKNMQSLEHEHF